MPKNARVTYEANKTAQVLFASFIEATLPKLLKWPFVIKSSIDCKAQLAKMLPLKQNWREPMKIAFLAPNVEKLDIYHPPKNYGLFLLLFCFTLFSLLMDGSITVIIFTLTVTVFH